MRTGFLALLLGAVAGAGADGDGGFPIEEVAPGVYVHRGVHAGLDEPQRGDSANLGFIVGGRCVAVVDTGGALAIGTALREAIGRVTGRPVCYVINTHVHFDHVLGNAAFVGEQVRFVGHRRLAEAMAANRAFFAERFARELAGRGGEAVIAPDTLVEERLRLDLGDRELLLEAHPAAHTSQDLTVLDERTGTVFLGDLVFMERVPALDGSLRGWVALLETLGAREFARAVPGHGPPVASWPEAAAPTRRYLGVLLADTRAAIAEGVLMEDAARAVGRSERDRWLLFDDNHGRNVIRAFKELEWE